MATISYTRLLTVTAQIKRSQAQAGGLFGTVANHLLAVPTTPLDPVDAETRQRLGLESFSNIKQVFTAQDWDIRVGDYLVIGSAQYPIKAVEDYADTTVKAGTGLKRLVVEAIQQ